MRVFLWFNFSAFQIEAFVHCLTHREGLARQDAINEDGLKQRFLWNGWEQNAHIVQKLKEEEGQPEKFAIVS